MIHRTISAFGGSLLLLSAPISSAAILAVAADGDINSGATWAGGLAPVSGDANDWDTGTLTVKTGTQTWEGQNLIVSTDGRLATNTAGPTLTFAGDLTLDGGIITVLNNNAFVINLAGNNFNLNSGTLDSGLLNSGRDLVFTNAVLAGSGNIGIQGGATAAADRSAVIFQNSVTTSGFTGLFEVTQAANFFLPNITVGDASFGIDVNGSGQLGFNNNTAVTSAVFDGIVITAGTWTRDQLLADPLDGGFGVNSNRVLAGTGTLTVIPEPSVALLGGLGLVALQRRRRA